MTNLDTLKTAVAKVTAELQPVAAQWTATLNTARATLADTEARFAAFPSLQRGQAVADARAELAKVEHLAALVEAAGGPAGIRAKSVNTPAHAKLAVAALLDREVALNGARHEARKALSVDVSELVADGMDPTLAGLHPAVHGLRSRVGTLESHLQVTLEARYKCERVDPDLNIDAVITLLETVIP